jgi:pilus assembly protein CpaB
LIDVMNRRIIAVVGAAIVALVGAGLVFAYAQGAEQRAMAGQSPVSVIVAKAPIPEGTPAEQLEQFIGVETVPTSAVIPGGVTEISELSGRVANTDIQAGEQLLQARFSTPEAVADANEVDVPADLHQVTVPLTAERVLGGHITPGDTVGVFVSLEGVEQSQGSAEAPPDATADRSHLVLHKVLVTRVQGGIKMPATSSQDQTEAGSNGSAPAAEPQPAAQLLVTLAVTPRDAERIVFAAEYARIWLSLEGAEAPLNDTGTVTEENVFG